MRFLPLSSLIGACLAAAPLFAATHPAADPARFDNQKALEISQAVIGKKPGNHVFTTTDGRRVTLANYRGQPLVVSLVYTSCHHICPTTTQHLAKVVRTARTALGEASVRVLTLGFDTDHDTPAAMRAFAQQQNVALSGWDFASADAGTMTALAQELGFIYYRAPQGFDHLIQATVIDAEGKIYRQVYGMTFETPQLVEPLKELVYGTPAGSSFLTALGNRVKIFCTVYDPATDRYRFDYSIFIGLFIGITSLGVITFFVMREWRRSRVRV
jgi:protein SCO1/2